MIDRSRIHWALTLSALGFAAAALVFGAWPGLDIATSAAFATPDGQFPARADPTVELVRQMLWDASRVLVLLSFAMMAIQGLARPASRIATRVWSFIFLSYLLGPGLLVNGILKTYWGRARPYEIDLFGGDATFTPALVAARQCARNCSFVSGETAGVVTLALVLTLTFVATVENGLVRRALLGLLWTAALAGATIRIATGAHFLSDVVFAALLTAIVTLALFLALGLERHLGGVTPGNVARDLRDHLAGARAALLRIARRTY